MNVRVAPPRRNPTYPAAARSAMIRIRQRRLLAAFGFCCSFLSFALTSASTRASIASSVEPAYRYRGGGKAGGNWLSDAAEKLRQKSADALGGLGSTGKNRATEAWMAYETRNSELTKQPDDAQLQLDTAEALLHWVRHTTNGNFPRASTGQVTEGDSPASRKIWRKHAPEALRLLKAGSAHALQSGGYDVAKYRFMHAEASTYLSSAKGILRAALQADAITFKRNVKPLIENHPAYQGGVGHTFMGAFYLAAPWPVHDLAKAKIHFDAALEIDPRCRRNHYCRGLVALKSGNEAEAKGCFQRAVKCGATSLEEEDVADFFLRESEEALKVIEAERA